MTLNEYQKETIRTLPDLRSKPINLAHMVLGIFSEYNELVNAILINDKVNIGEEIADMFWYISNYCNLKGYDLEQLYKESKSLNIGEIKIDVFIYNLSLLQDLVKKNLAYGKIISDEKECVCLRIIILSLTTIIQSEIDEKLEEILEKNINKLRIRFPDKFTEELAINRDLESERKELEK